MAPRSDLQALLVSLLGSNNVYFQPPSNLTMLYPCIRYEIDDINVDHANNKPYSMEKRYLVTYITRDADSDISEKIASLPKCAFNRAYRADSLYHHVFNIFF